MQSERLSISELASIYGLSLRTLRFYEQRGLLKPSRVGMARHYTGKDRVVLEVILKGKRLGFTLLEIERLLGVAADETHELSDTTDILRRLDEETVRKQLAQLERRRDEIDVAIAEVRRSLSSHEPGAL